MGCFKSETAKDREGNLLEIQGYSPYIVNSIVYPKDKGVHG